MATGWLQAGISKYRIGMLDIQVDGTVLHEISSHYSEQCTIIIYELINSRIFHLLYADHGGPLITETRKVKSQIRAMTILSTT